MEREGMFWHRSSSVRLAIRGKNGKQSRRTSRRGDRRKRTIKIRESSLGSGVEEERVELSVSSASTHSLYSLFKSYCLCNRTEEGELQDRDTMLWVLKCFVETVRTGIFSLMTGRPGPSGFGSATTAEQVTQGIDASGLTAIVTGGASGIGLETARVLALRGAHVIIAARNMEAAKEAKIFILEQCKTAKVDVLKLDLCSMRSVRSFADSFNALDLPLNILINNAGVMFCPFQLSEDRIEVQFATNHIGHFLLTNLLLDKMKHTARVTGIEGRIVNLSSIVHVHTYKEGIKFDKINDQLSYSDTRAYGQSKLANILHAKELSCRLQEEGANIIVNSVHPGFIMTHLMRHSVILMKILKVLTYSLWKNAPQGAATSCYVALHPNLKGVSGKYYADCNEVKPSTFARDVQLGKKLWDFSNKTVESFSSL